MRVLRAQVRSKSMPELSIPQFRALAFLGRNAGAMLSDVANFLALTLPSASKMVDGLFSAGLVERLADTVDRRKIALSLTIAGREKYDAAVHAAEAFLASRLATLDGRQRDEVLRAMNLLHSLFDDPPETRRSAAARRPNS
jgi:DNA-binding MarR family transcriptional regulator